jgi:hypothetical protein
MSTQGEQQKCFYKGCKGTMTWYQKLKVDEKAHPPVQPGDTIGRGPDPNYAGWICDLDWRHHRYDAP